MNTSNDTRNDARVIYQQFSKDGTFDTTAPHVITPIEDKVVQSILTKYDTNHDGVLDTNEIQPLLQDIELIKDVQKVMKKYDANSDGQLDDLEMKALVNDYASKDTAAIEILRRWDTNNDGTLDTKELQTLRTDVQNTIPPIRYTGYTFAITALLGQSVRYAAYTSDVGESFRPVVHPRIVTCTYGISWLYVLGDVAWEGYKARARPEPTGHVTKTVVERMLFQSLASMAFPALLIHTQVRIFKKLFTRVRRFQKWGPTVAGLGLVPLLPYILDKPIEHGLQWLIGSVWPKSWYSEERNVTV